MKIVAEGLALTMAEEITRLRSGAPQYGAGGAFEARHTPSAVALDRKA